MQTILHLICFPICLHQKHQFLDCTYGLCPHRIVSKGKSYDISQIMVLFFHSSSYGTKYNKNSIVLADGHFRKLQPNMNDTFKMYSFCTTHKENNTFKCQQPLKKMSI